MKLSVKVDDDAFVRSMKAINGAIVKSVNLQIKKSLKKIQKEARGTHRFKTLSGDLERSVQDFMENDLVGVVKIDLGIAIYGRRIHNGYGTWEPDKFLENAAKNNEQSIVSEVRAAYINAFRKVNLI